jgi:hypothetical protein
MTKRLRPERPAADRGARPETSLAAWASWSPPTHIGQPQIRQREAPGSLQNPFAYRAHDDDTIEVPVVLEREPGERVDTAAEPSSEPSPEPDAEFGLDDDELSIFSFGNHVVEPVGPRRRRFRRSHPRGSSNPIAD